MCVRVWGWGGQRGEEMKLLLFFFKFEIFVPREATSRLYGDTNTHLDLEVNAVTR